MTYCCAIRSCIICCFSLLISVGLSGQNLDTDRLFDWSGAGLQDDIAHDYNCIDLSSIGFTQDADHNDDLLADIFQNLHEEKNILILPEGTFPLSQSINLPSYTILKGQGYDKTKLVFINGMMDHAIKAVGTIYYDQNTTLLVAGQKDSDQIEIENSDNFKNGDWLWIRFDDDDFIYSNWAEKSAGQIVQIQSIENN